MIVQRLHKLLSFALLTLVYAACGRPTLPDGRALPQDECTTDRECAVSNDLGGGCCSNCRCPTEPFGMSATRHQTHVDECANQGACFCGPEPKACPSVALVNDFVAQCKQGTCVAVQK